MARPVVFDSNVSRHSPLKHHSLPRDSLDQSTYGTIDNILKDLKIRRRRLQNVLATHASELKILDRVYYKGKNQHRSALFWRRVAEVRRFGNRLQDLNVQRPANDLHFSFFGPEASENSALVKGPWTHIPGSQFLKIVLSVFNNCLCLSKEFCERLLNAYKCIQISMQSGAFLSYLLVLVAMVSRMRILVLEVQEILQHIVTLVHRVEDLVSVSKGGNQTLPATDSHSGLPSLISPDSTVPSDPASLREPSTETRHNTVPRIIVARQEKQLHDLIKKPKKSRLKKTFDEIDLIFGK